MNASFARLEALCANAVERTFALAFPTALEPVQVARKLVAAFESGRGPAERSGRVFTVRLSPADHARLARELPSLERQWTTMLERLGQRSGRHERSPVVRSLADPAIAGGTCAIASEIRPQPARLLLRVRRGFPAGATAAVDRPLTVGRDPSCDLVVVDPRASRRHLAIVPAGDGVHFRDLGSTNGTRHNGLAATSGTLACGDVLALGDTDLVVDADGERVIAPSA